MKQSRENSKPGRNQRAQDSKAVQNMNKKKWNRGNSTRNQRREKEAIDSMVHVSESNPFAWYDKNSQFTKDAAALPFGTPLGANILVGSSDHVTMAGVMRISYYPTVGYSKDLTSPINRQSFKLYNHLRGIMKAAAAYDAADIMMYLMAADSMFSFWALMRRAYGVAQLYTPLNRYYPRLLLAAMGFDPSIANNLAEFRAYINKFALSLGSFVVPESFDITARHMWMNSGLYLDSETTRAQTYVFCPNNFWIFDNTVTTGSQLKPAYWQVQGANTPTLHNLSDIQAFGDAMLNAVINDQDSIMISGDLSRAYEGRNRKLEMTEEGYVVLPIFDRTVLSQIENATICGDVVDATPTNFRITQDPSVNNGAIIFRPYFKVGEIQNTSGSRFWYPEMTLTNRVLNIHSDSPNTEQVMEATRLMAAVSSPLDDSFTESTPFQLDVIPADVVSGIWIFRYNPDTYPAYNTLAIKRQNMCFTNGGNGLLGTTALLSYFQSEVLKRQFDWAPLTYIYQYVSDTLALNLLDISGEIDNLTIIDAQQLQNLHEAAMWSLFTIDQPSFSN